jgi:hypothetical protein
MLAHGLPAAMVCSILMAALARRRWRVFWLSFLTFHLHLLCDLVGSRGPDKGMFEKIKEQLPPPRKKSPICGGFFDVPGRAETAGGAGRLDGAGGLLEQPRKSPGPHRRSQRLRKKTEPILKAERQIEDFKVMLELAQEEPESEQPNTRRKWNGNWPNSRGTGEPGIEGFPQRAARQEQLHPEHQRRRRRHRGLRLGGDAPAHVPALGAKGAAGKWN